MEPLDIEALKEKAEKATPGPWQIGRLGTGRLNHVVDFGEPPKAPFIVMVEGHPGNSVLRAFPASGVCHSDDGSSENNAAYIAACSPDVILSLISELSRLRSENEGMRKALEAARIYVENAVNRDGGIDNCDIAYRVDLEAIDAALSSLKEEDAR